jgi:hypothetical protein
MKKMFVAVYLSVLIVVLSGCEALLLGAATDFNIKVETPEVSIARGSTGKVSLSVSQTSPVNVLPTPIELSLHNPPTGVTADSLSIPSGIDKDDLIIQVSADAQEGGPSEVTIRASNGLKTKEVTFNLTITP